MLSQKETLNLMLIVMLNWEGGIEALKTKRNPSGVRESLTSLRGKGHQDPFRFSAMDAVALDA